MHLKSLKKFLFFKTFSSFPVRVKKTKFSPKKKKEKKKGHLKHKLLEAKVLFGDQTCYMAPLLFKR